MDLDVKSQTLVDTFDQANFNSIPEYMHVALITLLTYSVSTCTAKHSFSSMKRLQTLTKNHDRQKIEFSCNSTYEHKDIIDIDGITDYVYQYLIAYEINAQGCGGGGGCILKIVTAKRGTIFVCDYLGGGGVKF